MNSDLFVIGSLLLGSIVVGVVLYIPVRWAVLRSSSDATRSQIVGKQELLWAFLSVSVVLGLFGFAVYGSTIASVAYAALVFSATIYARVLIKKDRHSKDT